MFNKSLQIVAAQLDYIQTECLCLLNNQSSGRITTAECLSRYLMTWAHCRSIAAIASATK